MEAAVEAHYLVLLPGRLAYLPYLSSEFDGGFICFGSRIADEDLGRCRHGAGRSGALDKQLGESANPGIVIEV